MFYFCFSAILSIYHPSNIILSFYIFISYNPEMKTEWETWATAIRNIKKLKLLNRIRKGEIGQK